MADVYVDMDLATGLNDGSDWTNAYQDLATALNGTNAVSGDLVYVKGTLSTTGSKTFIGGALDNPIIVLGCKSTTTNEPPVTSDLIPGWRTGETKTEANLAYNDGDIPTYTVTGSTDDLNWTDSFYVYALSLVAADNHGYGGNTAAPAKLIIEECYMAFDSLTCGTTDGQFSHCQFVNCHSYKQLTTEGIGISDGGIIEFFGGKVTAVSAARITTTSHRTVFAGVDFSDAAHHIVDISTGSDDANPILQNCKFHASGAFVSGASTAGYRVEGHGTSSVTGKSSGASFQEIDIVDSAGTIVEETTVVRTGGADDGASGQWSLAFTPNSGKTVPQYSALWGPWMAFKLAGDGTAKTVDVYFAHSAASALQDDEIWLEVMYPSPDGDALYFRETDQVDLLTSPSNVTTGGTWAGSPTHTQKLSVSVSPDYEGRAYCRVHVATGGTDTIYVDPVVEVS